jgi:hypothetical protein
MKVQVRMTKTISPKASDAFRKKCWLARMMLKGMLFELQARYGRDAVVAAVMDVAGCSGCIADKTAHDRAESLRALLDRPAVHRDPSGTRN